MDALETMKVFVRVAQRGGFARAARELRMSAPAVTKHVAALEARVGARLLDRTTRSVALTEAGRVYLGHCLECLQSFDDADASVGELAKEPRGLLRVAGPIDIQSHIARAAARVMSAHPNLSFDLVLSNRTADLVEHGIDVAVRGGTSLDGRYVARPLCRVTLPLLAAPVYLARYGRPKAPADLTRHRHLVFAEPKPMTELSFAKNGRRVSVHVEPVMTVNSGESLRVCVLQGVGICALPTFLIRGATSMGELEPVLPDWKHLYVGRFYAVYPHRRFLSPKVRVFVEALRAEFGDAERDPWSPD
jgi:DNA-binding transcriptional LysR family regulator